MPCSRQAPRCSSGGGWSTTAPAAPSAVTVLHVVVTVLHVTVLYLAVTVLHVPCSLQAPRCSEHGRDCLTCAVFVAVTVLHMQAVTVLHVPCHGRDCLEWVRGRRLDVPEAEGGRHPPPPPRSPEPGGQGRGQGRREKPFCQARDRLRQLPGCRPRPLSVLVTRGRVGE